MVGQCLPPVLAAPIGQTKNKSNGRSSCSVWEPWMKPFVLEVIYYIKILKTIRRLF